MSEAERVALTRVGRVALATTPGSSTPAPNEATLQESARLRFVRVFSNLCLNTTLLGSFLERSSSFFAFSVHLLLELTFFISLALVVRRRESLS